MTSIVATEFVDLGKLTSVTITTVQFHFISQGSRARRKRAVQGRGNIANKQQGENHTHTHTQNGYFEFTYNHYYFF